MTDRPIIFSAPMVKALLEGRKTMTRRLAWGKPKPFNTPEQRARFAAKGSDCRGDHAYPPTIWQKVRPGDRIYVRETWKPHSIYAHLRPRDVPHTNVFYKADDSYAPSNTHWRRSIHMPRWASRLTLVVTATKIERLQDISDEDIAAEGLRIWGGGERDAKDEWRRLFHSPVPGREHEGDVGPVVFRDLWNSLHGPDAWAENPEVCAISFRLVKQNIDGMGAAA